MLECDARAKICLITGMTCSGDDCMAWKQDELRPDLDDTGVIPFSESGVCVVLEAFNSIIARPVVFKEIKYKVERLET